MLAFRLINRSITMARANTEQAMRGQIGQPAACMMENKWSLRTDAMLRDYGVRWRPTEHVDKFVQNYCPRGWEAAPKRGFDRLMTKAATKKPMKSNTYDAAPCNARGVGPKSVVYRSLWSVHSHCAAVARPLPYV